MFVVQREQTGESRTPDMLAPDAFPFASQVLREFYNHASVSIFETSRFVELKTARSKFNVTVVIKIFEI